MRYGRVATQSDESSTTELATNSLSATGSRIAPTRLVWLSRRARYPSSLSVRAMTPKTPTAAHRSGRGPGSGLASARISQRNTGSRSSRSTVRPMGHVSGHRPGTDGRSSVRWDTMRIITGHLSLVTFRACPVGSRPRVTSDHRQRTNDKGPATALRLVDAHRLGDGQFRHHVDAVAAAAVVVGQGTD